MLARILLEDKAMARLDALHKMQNTLLGRRSVLSKRLGGDLDGLSNSLTGGDAADAAFDNVGEELASQLAELEAKELSQIDRALLRIKQGMYGICDGCECKIPVARLSALPYSTMCIRCQRDSEKDGNWEADHEIANWEKVRDHGSDDKEVRLSDFEVDYSK